MENINNAKQNVIIGVVMKLKNAGLVSANAAESTVHNGNKLLNNAENFEKDSMNVAAPAFTLGRLPINALCFCIDPLLLFDFLFVVKEEEEEEEKEVFLPPAFEENA